MTKKIPIIYDCDPGQDDAISILMILASQDTLDLRGITTVAGNVSVEQTFKNARKLCEFAGHAHIKVFKGCSTPLVIQRDAHTNNVHGECGLKGSDIPDPTMPELNDHAVDFIIQELLKSEEKVTIVATAPQTNVATALIKRPEIKQKIERIVIMGGTVGIGNITPAAEYNFWSDPHAAHVVLSSGLPIVLFGLNLTLKTMATLQWIDSIRSLGNPVAVNAANMIEEHGKFEASVYGTESGPVHDANTIAYLLKPHLYQGRHCFVDVEVASDKGMGRTYVDWFGVTGRTPNVFVMDEVDREGFFQLVIDLMDYYSIPLKRVENY